MIAFAGNSILCRMALKETSIDPASFTSIRPASGAAVLWAITIFFRRDQTGGGNRFSALALFVYAAGFSFAYISLTAATGALMLFGVLVSLFLPGLCAPPLIGLVLRLVAGMAWGVYSIVKSKGGQMPNRYSINSCLRLYSVGYRPFLLKKRLN
jgi:hypothetical protein